MRLKKARYEINTLIKLIEAKNQQKDNDIEKDLYEILLKKKESLKKIKEIKSIFKSTNQINKSEEKVFNDSELKVIKNYINNSNGEISDKLRKFI